MTNEEAVIRWQSTTNRNIKNQSFKVILKNNNYMMRLPLRFIDNYKYNEHDFMQFLSILIAKKMNEYDISRGVKFISYLSYTMRASINLFRRDDGLMKPHETTIYKSTGIKSKNIAKHQKVIDGVIHNPKRVIIEHRIESLNAPISNNDDTEMINVIPDVIPETNDNEFYVEKILDLLNQRERFVMEAYFGIKSGEGLILQDIADMLGVTREMVRQIKCTAIKKLKNQIKYQNLLRNPIFVTMTKELS